MNVIDQAQGETGRSTTATRAEVLAACPTRASTWRCSARRSLALHLLRDRARPRQQRDGRPVLAALRLHQPRAAPRDEAGPQRLRARRADPEPEGQGRRDRPEGLPGRHHPPLPGPASSTTARSASTKTRRRRRSGPRARACCSTRCADAAGRGRRWPTTSWCSVRRARTPCRSVPDITNDDWIEWARPIWYGIRETDTLNVAEGRESEDERHICPLQLGTIERASASGATPARRC
jgi:hypothetical protein